MQPEHITRRLDWANYLASYISEARINHACLDWVNNNCVSWAAGAVKAMTQVDLYPDLGDVGSPAKAHRGMKSLGFDKLSDLVASKLPIREGRPIRGDIVLVPVDGEGEFLTATAPDWEGRQPQLGLNVGLCIFDYPVCWGLTVYGVDSIPFDPAWTVLAVGKREDVLCLK